MTLALRFCPRNGVAGRASSATVRVLLENRPALATMSRLPRHSTIYLLGFSQGAGLLDLLAPSVENIVWKNEGHHDTQQVQACNFHIFSPGASMRQAKLPAATTLENFHADLDTLKTGVMLAAAPSMAFHHSMLCQPLVVQIHMLAKPRSCCC